MPIPQWLDWAQRLQAVAQTGAHYKPSSFDQERYDEVGRIAAEMLTANGNLGLNAVQAIFDAQTGHATPKVDVRGVVFHENKILLVQEKQDNYLWTLPGGWADIGESPSENTAREVYEESGYRVRAVKLLALYDRNRHPHPPYPFHAYKAFFQCELIDPDRRVSAETSASFVETGLVDWFAEDALPELSINRVTPQQIARFFEHLRQPALGTDFD